MRESRTYGSGGARGNSRPYREFFFAAVHESGFGTKCKYRHVRYYARSRSFSGSDAEIAPLSRLLSHSLLLFAVTRTGGTFATALSIRWHEMHGMCAVLHYIALMIRTFRHKGLKELFERGASRRVEQIYIERCRQIFAVNHNARNIQHINLPSYALHPLKGKRSATWSVRVAVSADMALRLGAYFGNGPELWLNLRQDHDLWHARQAIKAQLAKIARAAAARAYSKQFGDLPREGALSAGVNG